MVASTELRASLGECVPPFSRPAIKVGLGDDSEIARLLDNWFHGVQARTAGRD